MRITGGSLRSRRLSAPKGDLTRPTTDRVREAIFSALHARGALSPGAQVLDLYAGTGALSFDAISRGAGRAVLVESDRAALTVIRENAETLGVTAQIELLGFSVAKAILLLEKGAVPAAFDLVFADPPYARVPTKELAAELSVVAKWVAPEGLIVLEHGKRDSPPAIDGISWEPSRAYGDTHVSMGVRTH